MIERINWMQAQELVDLGTPRGILEKSLAVLRREWCVSMRPNKTEEA